MYRGGGILSLVIGATLVYFLAFTPFDEPVGRWTRPEEGTGFIQVKVECPGAWATLVEGEVIDSDFVRTDRGQCTRAARTHMTGALIVGGLAGALGVRGVLRGPAPPPKPLGPLSEKIHRRREHVDSGPG